MTVTPAPYRLYSPSAISSHDTSWTGAYHTTAATSQAWPAANIAVYLPFSVGTATTVYETWVCTGTLTDSNNIEIGCYNLAGTRLFTTAMTITTASDTVNSSGMTDYTLDRGSYYMAMSCDGTRNFLATSQSIGLYQAAGCLEETGLTGATLPATATFATYTRAYLPVFGFNLTSTAR